MSPAISIIRHLPAAPLLLRLYNRFLMHFRPLHVATTYFGARFNCDVRDMIQGTLIHFGAWEPNISRVFERVIKEGDTVVDVGANIGYYSLLFSKLVGPKGHVVAIEALPKLAVIAADHVWMNGAENVRVFNGAVTDTPGTVQLYEGSAINIGQTTTRADRGLTPSAIVYGQPLTDILTHEDIERATLIKIDIEGAEVPVLNHLLDNLNRFSVDLKIAVEASPEPEWEALFARFQALGFHAYDMRNDYSWVAMMRGAQLEPARIVSAPQQMADILFTRTPLA